MYMKLRSCLLGLCLACSLLMAACASPLTIPSSRALTVNHPTVIVFDFHTVVGRPTLNAAFVNRVLALYGSPARGLGQSLYALGKRYGLDDAYALAFFQHESRFGTTGWGAVNRSLGNIRCSQGYVCQGDFRHYATWQAGFEDWYRLIRYGYVQGHITIPLVGHVCTTVAQIVPVYAPQSDGNDVAGYIQAVEHAVDTWRRGEVQA